MGQIHLITTKISIFSNNPQIIQMSKDNNDYSNKMKIRIIQTEILITQTEIHTTQIISLQTKTKTTKDNS